jgi:cyclopropane fatty-acyl-phospholipid synthase-like methyltransferase
VDYFDDEKNVAAYIKMAEGYDGRQLIAILKKYLASEATVLELGMGPGKDFEILSKDYQVTGSDNARPFLERYKQQHPTADIIQLDAVEMNTDRTFDAIYSNKVLHHLTRANLATSLQRQTAVLNPGGIAFHSLWYGDNEDVHHGLRFTYYTPESFSRLIGPGFRLLEMQQYTELNQDDSLYVVLQKQQ